jgi:GTPase SAR1 family protein
MPTYACERGFLCTEATREKIKLDLKLYGRPVIVVGCDGTGKTTLIEDWHGKKEVIKFTRETANDWDSNPEPKAGSIYDRHPVIDWPVYEAVRIPGTDETTLFAYWLDRPTVADVLSKVTVVWLTHQYTKTAEGRDLDFVVGKDDRIQEMYEKFFAIAKAKDVCMHVIKEVNREQ